jgi:aminopeptidase
LASIENVAYLLQLMKSYLLSKRISSKLDYLLTLMILLITLREKVKKGERLAIRTPAIAAPLVREIYRAALRAGALPETFITLPGLTEILYKEGSDEQLTYISQPQRLIWEEYETMVSLWAATNTKELNNVEHARVALAQKAKKGLLATQLQREMAGTFRGVAALYPTEAAAQDAEMSLSDFEDFAYRACFLDDENPVARWKELSEEQEHLVLWLKGKRTVHLCGLDTDLIFSIVGRPFLSCDGHLNFPDGEIFTSPIENSANGYIPYYKTQSLAHTASQEPSYTFHPDVFS